MLVPLALGIGSFILRTAVVLTNKVLGGAEPSDLAFYDEPSGYRRYPRTPAGLAIPVPTPGRAMGILLLVGVVDFAVRCGIMMAAGFGGGNDGMAALITLPVSLVVHVALLPSLLPTGLGRAFLVLVFQFVIVVLICVVIGAAFVALTVGHAGTR